MTAITANGPKPALDDRLAALDVKIAIAEKYRRRACSTRHGQGDFDQLDAIKETRRKLADLERERAEVQAALDFVAESAQTAQAGQRATEDLENRWEVLKRLCADGAQSLKDGRQGAELWPMFEEHFAEWTALTSKLSALTNKAQYRPSSLPTRVALVGDALAEARGWVKTGASGRLIAIRQPPSPPRQWPWEHLVQTAQEASP
jgi:hypothetical protein